jgi:hypothetical protein
MGGSPGPDGAVVKFEVTAIQGNVVTIAVEENKAAYFEVGYEYEATVREKKS